MISATFDYISAVSSVITIALFAAAVVGSLITLRVYAKNKTAQHTQVLLQSDNEAMRKYIDRVDADLVRITKRVEHVERENTLLRELVTQAAKVDKLAELLTSQYNTILQALNVTIHNTQT